MIILQLSFTTTAPILHTSYTQLLQENRPTAATEHEMLRHKSAAGSVSRQQDPAAGSCGLLPLTRSRRGALASLVALLPLAQASAPHLAAAAQEQAEPACASCVGYVEGTLGSCSAVAVPCSSSYDDRPQHFVAPWTYDGSREAAIEQLVDQLQVRQQRLNARPWARAPGFWLCLELISRRVFCVSPHRAHDNSRTWYRNNHPTCLRY